MIGTATVAAVRLKGGFDPREIFFERDEGIYLRMSLYINGPLFLRAQTTFYYAVPPNGHRIDTPRQ